MSLPGSGLLDHRVVGRRQDNRGARTVGPTPCRRPFRHLPRWRALRDAIADDLGHSIGHRLQSATRNARLCRLLAKQGIDVVCATISLFHSVQRWNRENIRDYHEIYLRVPTEELHRRDSKGIYARAQRGEAHDVWASVCQRRLRRSPI